MEFAINYSPQAAALVAQNRLTVERFKCPPWDETIAEAEKTRPVYLHLPLRVGAGIGDAIDTERNQPADWRRFEALCQRTNTPYINLHLYPLQSDFPNLPTDTDRAEDRERLFEAAVRDIEAVVRRFGAEKVMVENVYSIPGENFHLSYHPAYLRQLMEAAGCGLLLDIAHASIASAHWGMDAREYLSAMPLERICEIHLAGIQIADEHWQAILRATAPKLLQQFAGRPLDHLPMTEDDFALCGWAFDQLKSGAWKQPWVVSLEYGGIGALWEALTDEAVLSEQVPRLYELLQREVGAS